MGDGGTSYDSGLKAARDLLRPFALQGEHEAAIIVDRDTGLHLDFQTGGRGQVTPDWIKIPAGAKATVLHTHTIDVAFGAEDWDCLANQASVTEIQAVCPNEIYVLKKPDDWPFQEICQPGLSALGSYFQRLLTAVRVDPNFAPDRFPSIIEQWTAQICETNERMVRSALAEGFRFFQE